MSYESFIFIKFKEINEKGSFSVKVCKDSKYLVVGSALSSVWCSSGVTF